MTSNCRLPITHCHSNWFLMLSEEEVRTKILAAVPTLPVEKVPLRQAARRFSATELVATIPLPSFDNSAMDGYAVIASLTTTGTRLNMVFELPAGMLSDLRDHTMI